MALPDDSTGSVGRATRASAEKGRRLYEYIQGRIRERVFQVPAPRKEPV